MKNINELTRLPQPVWIVNISNDPISGLGRVFESDGLYISSWGITLRGMIYFKDGSGDKITNVIRYKPYFIELVASVDSTGPFIDSTTGDRVYPDSNGEVPDNTILRYDALMYKLNQNVNINTEVLAFITSADANHEFDI